MGVFTTVVDEEFSRWVQPAFGFSAVGALAPIEDGFQNTNYSFTADGKKFVFTIFENTAAEYVEYYIDFVRHLAQCDAPVPASLRPDAPTGLLWQEKLCCISPFLPGDVLDTPQETHCYKLGRMVAHLHLNSQKYPMKIPPYGAGWLTDTRDKLLRMAPEPLPPASQEFLVQAVHQALKFYTRPVPWQACHTDLHRCNVLWEHDEISGVIDFYSGGGAPLLFDLGILVSNWCLEPRPAAGPQNFSPALVKALLAGYQSLRPLTAVEKQHFGGAVIAAAVKFWSWCLNEKHFPRPAVMMTPKDPTQFHQISLKAYELGPGDWIKNYC